MDSPYLLVVDSSPDQAQLIKSFLRNAGLAVRVLGADNVLGYIGQPILQVRIPGADHRQIGVEVL